jgi:hypothetical protein
MVARPGARAGLVASMTVLAAVTFAVAGVDGPWQQVREHRTAVAAYRPVAAQLLRATDVMGATSRDSVYLASPGPVDSLSSNQWYLALRAEWTAAADLRAESLAGFHEDLPAVTTVADAWLQAHPGSLVVPPELRAALVPGLESSQADRVRTW